MTVKRIKAESSGNISFIPMFIINTFFNAMIEWVGDINPWTVTG